MTLQQSGMNLFIKIVQKRLSPKPQRFHVMATDIFHILHNQRPVRLRTYVVQQLRDGRQIAAGEDVLIDEAIIAPVSFGLSLVKKASYIL